MAFQFTLTENIRAAPNSPDAESITLKNNNSATTLAIPIKYRNAGYRNMVAYFKNSPLAFALTMTPCHTYPQALIEFWYTCVVATTDFGSTIISATIGNGRNIAISAEHIRRYLQLPSGPFVNTPNPTECRHQVLRYIRYPGVANSPKRIQMNAFWSYFFGVIIWCIGHKSGSKDQCNNFELQIGHALIFGRNVDFAALIFTELREKIEKKKKEKNVPFPRFLSLIFEGIFGNDYNDLEESDAEDVFLGDKIFHRAIEKPHKGLSPEMLAIIPLDEILDSDPDTEQAVVPLPESSSSSDSYSGDQPEECYLRTGPGTFEQPIDIQSEKPIRKVRVSREEEPRRQEESMIFVLSDDEESNVIEDLKKEILELKVTVDEQRKKIEVMKKVEEENKELRRKVQDEEQSRKIIVDENKKLWQIVLDETQVLEEEEERKKVEDQNEKLTTQLQNEEEVRNRLEDENEELKKLVETLRGKSMLTDGCISNLESILSEYDVDQ